MSPVGGVGINYAIQDATEAANLLAQPLKDGSLTVGHLAKVQKKREFPTRFIQGFQSFAQKRIMASVLQSQAVGRIPLAVRILFRIPVIRDIPARLIGFGIGRARVRN